MYNVYILHCQALEASFTHESLAKAVGVNPTKGLIIAHLGEKFLALIGPTCAQRKVDVMQHKHFTPMDPMEQPPKVSSKPHPDATPIYCLVG